MFEAFKAELPSEMQQVPLGDELRHIYMKEKKINMNK